MRVFSSLKERPHYDNIRLFIWQLRKPRSKNVAGKEQAINKQLLFPFAAQVSIYSVSINSLRHQDIIYKRISI